MRKCEEEKVRNWGRRSGELHFQHKNVGQRRKRVTHSIKGDSSVDEMSYASTAHERIATKAIKLEIRSL